MRRAFFTLILLVLGSFFANAQENPPYWVNQLPKPENGTYYFRVTHAEGLTYEKAYVQAFSMAILESSWKMGLPVDAKNDLAAIEQGVENNLSIRSHQSHIAINKVCEWQTKSVTSNKIVLFVLWQVASSGNVEADFGFFEKCK